MIKHLMETIMQLAYMDSPPTPVQVAYMDSPPAPVLVSYVDSPPAPVLVDRTMMQHPFLHWVTSLGATSCAASWWLLCMSYGRQFRGIHTLSPEKPTRSMQSSGALHG